LKRLLFLIVITAIPALYFSGCVPSKPTEEVEILPSERLINKLEANRRRIKTFEGTGTISIKSDQLNNSASFRIVVSKPDSIYLTIMGPFGIELAQAYVTKDNFAFYDALQNTVYKGAASDDILKEIFKINLSFNDLLDAFVGSVNLTDKLYLPPNGYEIVYDQYILKYTDSIKNQQTKYVVDVRELGITEYALTNNNEELLQGKYSKFSILEGVAVPYNIRIRNKRDNQLLEIDYRNMRANKKDIYIKFDVPDDATVIRW
jgi:outer membrane lipoprotein-sorting protein